MIYSSLVMAYEQEVTQSSLDWLTVLHSSNITRLTSATMSVLSSSITNKQINKINPYRFYYGTLCG